MKAFQKLFALSAVSLFGVACQSNKTASSDPYNTSGQSYGATGNTSGQQADPYASSGEYDNVYSSGGGQNYGGASSYGSDDYYQQAPQQQPGYQQPSYQQPSYEAPSYSSGGGAPASSTSHTVQRGDTLFNISRRYGTSVSALRRANGINGDLIRIGETLMIP
jgi:LysM repeat protein